jgi:hypothetical protein
MPVPFELSTSVTMETRLLFFPLPSYQVQLLDSVPRPPLYNLNILSVFTQICWKMLFTFFFHSAIAALVGAIHFQWIDYVLKEIFFSSFFIIALKSYCIIWSDF